VECRGHATARAESRRTAPVGQILGVPLHGDHPRLLRVGGFGALDHPVVGPCDRREARCEIADRLMVPAVHARRARAQRSLEQRARLDVDGMTARLVVVGTGPGLSVSKS